MRYEDASHTGAFQGSQPVANDDLDSIPAGSRTPATGNLISGEGTQTGSAGADVAPGAHVAAIAGKSGEDTSFSGGKLSVSGEYGSLTVDKDGNYSYLANKGVENVRDRFTYTLADNNGATDTGALIVEIGKTPVVIKADAQQIVPGPDGVVTLPPGVELSDIMVVGRNLVINMPDGTQLIIVDGAIFVPQLVLGGVEVPATNLAALLIGQEPQPAAGEAPQSSGGNFEAPVPPLDPGVPLGDLIPPTEYDYNPPEPEEVFDIVDREPSIQIQPDGQPASVAAVDSVDEDGLPTRDGDLPDEPEGSDEGADGNPSNNSDSDETTGGTIIIDSPDGVDSVTINGVLVTGAIGQVIPGEFGNLTITGFNGDNILYSYTLTDNTSGDDTQDDFTVVLTDEDGDTATATLTIDIIDDVPTARNDTDATVNGVATGNVMTDAAPGDAGDSDTNAADTVGADNATLTSVSGAGGSDSTFEGGLLTVNGQFGVLTIDAQGNYTYTVNPNVGGGGVDVFTYTLTDGDGDTTQATLTITNPDLTPTLPNPDAVLLDDDALANGNPGGTGDDPDSQGLPGQLSGSGGDGDLDYNFTDVNTLPAGFTTNVVDASTVQILQGATVVLTITLDNETGAFNVVQNNPIDHPVVSETEDNLVFQIGVEVEDADGDVEPATITINVDDDTPELGEVTSGAGVDVDETDAGSPAGFPISDTSAAPVISATPAFGADGPAAVNSIVYGLAITGGPGSGLQTAIGNFAITLVQVDDFTIVGQYDDGGAQTAFTIVINADGTVTLTQEVPLEHLVDGAPGAPHNDTLDLTGLINATITITDGDGDTASASAPIGDNLVFFDDGPDAQVDGEASLDTLVLDETTPPGTETDGDSDPAGLVSVTANFADNFVSPVDHGADGPGTVTYSLLLSANGIGSGLYTVDPTDLSAGDGDGYGQGVEITLSQVGNVITGSAGGTDYFTISIDPVTGVVTFTQLDNIWHSNTGSDDDTSTLTTDDAANVQVVQTVTDSDGDFDTASVNVGAGVFQIEDDGPVATNDVDTIAGGGDSATGNVITGVGTVAGAGNADDVGADQPGTITAISGFGGSDSVFNGGVLEIDGQYGTLVIDAAGNYTYTRFDGAPGNVQDVFTYTLTDADGDGDTGTLTINIGDAAPVLPDPALVRLDDDALAGGNPGGAGDDPDTAGLPGQLNGSGGDGALTYNFTGVVTLPPALGFTYNQVDADTAQILQGATVVLTIELNQATGAFNVIQNNPIDHPVVSATEDNLVFQVGVEVEDADGDVEPATITINVDDDTPVLQNVTSGAGVDVDETDAGSPAGFPISDTSTDPVIDADALFGADGPAAVNSTVYGLSIVGGSPEPSGLQTAIGNFAITLVQIDGDTIEGQYQDGGTQTAFTIQMNADGTVTLTQEVPLEHLVDGAPGAPHNDTLDLSGLINATITITDGDGDTATASAPIGDNLVFFDDGPDAQVDGQATLDQLVLDETRPVGQDSDSGDNNPGGLATVQANFANNFVAPVDFGGDGAGTTAYSLLLSAGSVGSGLYALDNSDTDAGDGDGYGQGDQIMLTQVGNVITGSAGGEDYFTISIDPVTGVVTFTQLLNIWHSNTGSDDETATLTTAAAANVQVVQTVTDSDGDFDTASINVGQGVFHIEDDGPEIIAVDNVLDIDNEGPTPSGTGDFDFDIGTDAPNGGNDDIFIDPATFTVQVNGVDATNIVFNEGVENATTASYSFSFDYDTGAGGTTTANGTLVFDKAAGTYTVVLDAPIAGFTIVQTSDPGTTFQEFDLDGGAPDVVVAQLGTNLFAQFVAESTNNGGTEHLLTTGGGNTAWNPGELFTADPGNPQVSNTDAGVDGNTMDTGEVLDFNLYSADPGSDTTPAAPVTSATDMFIQFFQFAGDDLIVVLKLGMDSNNDGTLDTFTTRAIIVDPTDLFYNTDSAAGSPYEGMVDALGNQDALLVIESNDYNAEGEEWVIVGAQIVTDEDGTSGSGVNLVGGLGDAGASDTNNDGAFTGGEAQAFSTDTDTSGVKITSIGFLVQDTTDQSATIDFDVTVTDADGDTQTESITVNVGAPVAPAQLPFAAESEQSADTSSFSLLASDSQDQQLQKTAANSNTLTLAAAVAAAGMVETQAAAAPADDNGNRGHRADETSADHQSKASASSESDVSSSPLSNDEPEAANDSAPADSSSHRSDPAESDHSLDDSSAKADAEPSGPPAADNDQGPASSPVEASPAALAVGMPSAEALLAAGVAGNAQHGGAVEQIVADALGHGNASAAVDALLNALPGGNGAVGALANLASPAANAVPGGDMSMHGAFGAGHDMIMNMHVPMHHDAVQPVANG